MCVCVSRAVQVPFGERSLFASGSRRTDETAGFFSLSRKKYRCVHGSLWFSPHSLRAFRFGYRSCFRTSQGPENEIFNVSQSVFDLRFTSSRVNSGITADSERRWGCNLTAKCIFSRSFSKIKPLYLPEFTLIRSLFYTKIRGTHPGIINSL